MDYYYQSDCGFTKKTFFYLYYHSMICIVFLTILLVMPTTMIYIGVKNLMNCPVEPMIPVYLFIGGSFGLIKLVQILWKQWRVRRKERYDREDSTYDVELQHELQNRSIGFNGGSKFIDTAITIFLLIWFVCGNYWVIRIWWPNFQQPPERGSSNWCSGDVYKLSIIHLVACYTLGILFLLTTVCLVLYSRIKRVSSIDDREISGF